MARRRGARSGEEHFPEPNLIPLMNVILMLICALVTMAGSLPLSLLSTAAQKLSSGAGGAPEKVEEKKQLTLIVFVTEAGFNISVGGTVRMGEPDPRNPGRKLPLIPNVVGPDGDPRFDFAGLRAALTEIKKLDPTEELVTITADPKVKFDVIVQVMDWSRYDADKNILFPKVSFAAGIVG